MNTQPLWWNFFPLNMDLNTKTYIMIYSYTHTDTHIWHLIKTGFYSTHVHTLLPCSEFTAVGRKLFFEAGWKVTGQPFATCKAKLGSCQLSETRKQAASSSCRQRHTQKKCMTELQPTVRRQKTFLFQPLWYFFCLFEMIQPLTNAVAAPSDHVSSSKDRSHFLCFFFWQQSTRAKQPVAHRFHNSLYLYFPLWVI